MNLKEDPKEDKVLLKDNKLHNKFRSTRKINCFKV